MPQVEEKKQERKAQLRIACGGIGGLVVLGGALAAAALMAALRNRSRQRPTKKNHSEEMDSSSKGDGVLSLLQTPSPSMEGENHQSQYEEASVIHSGMTDSPDSVAVKSLILDTLTYHSQVNVEEETPKYVNGEMDLDNSREGDLSEADGYATRNIGIPMGEEDADPVHAAAVETTDTFRESIDKGEENPSMQLLGNDNKEDHNAGDSEGTGDSSLESNAEAVWPTDLIECPLKTQMKSPGNIVEKEAENGVDMEEFMEVMKEETGSVEVMINGMQSDLGSRVVFVSSMVGLLFLLLLCHLIPKSFSPSVFGPPNAPQSL